jgi:hypothetical protein
MKHISVIVCMSAAGESLLPYIVTSQHSQAVQERLKEQGVCFGSDMILPFNQKPSIVAQETAVLLMDHCSAHFSDDVIRMLTEAKVRVITFPSRTTQVFQVLDLTLFGVLKRRPRYELPFDEDNSMVKFIMKLYHDFRQTMIQPNRRRAFFALGLEFEFDMRRDPYGLLFDEVKLRASAGFEELWSADFPLDQLSGRRRAVRFGWTNKPD